MISQMLLSFPLGIRKRQAAGVPVFAFVLVLHRIINRWYNYNKRRMAMKERIVTSEPQKLYIVYTRTKPKKYPQYKMEAA